MKALPAMRAAAVAIALLAATTGRGQDGFAASATGGAGGPEVVVRTADEFRAAVGREGAAVIRVDGNLAIGSTPVASNKTILGERNAVLTGNLFLGGGTRNVILRDLTITHPMTKKGKGGGDAVTIRGGKQVWIDHCTFFNAADGCVDVTEGANDVTISWCRFSYDGQPNHRFVMLANGTGKKKKKGKKGGTILRLTLHHNWFAEGCESRMPAARRAHIHMYNNLFTCRDNEYCTNGREDSEILSRNNFYDGVRNPLYAEDNARLNAIGNIFRDCSGKIENGDDTVFTPPYPWHADEARDVPKIVRAGAGAGGRK